jgi:hypothetical protein
MGIGVGAAWPPKLDGSTSWAMFQRQFKTMAQHNYQQPHEEGTNLITTLNVPAAHILQ